MTTKKPAATDRPILFNTEMVQAVLAGRKTQTRRPVKPQPISETSETDSHITHFSTWKGTVLTGKKDWFLNQCPFGKVGDTLWVRERFAYGSVVCEVDYEIGRNDEWLEQCGTKESLKSARNTVPYQWAIANDIGIEEVTWTPSIHMPRYASRLQLEITNVRVERVTDISYIEAKAEGISYERGYSDPRDVFSRLWDSIYGKPKNGVDLSWAADPWAWVVGFEVLTK